MVAGTHRMSASTASSLLSGTAAVALPAAGIAVIEASPAPEQLKQAALALGGLAFLATLAANLVKLMRAARGVMAEESRPERAAGEYVTREELAAQITRLERRIDANRREQADDLKALTNTMRESLMDMTAAISELKGEFKHVNVRI